MPSPTLGRWGFRAPPSGAVAGAPCQLCGKYDPSGMAQKRGRDDLLWLAFLLEVAISSAASGLEVGLTVLESAVAGGAVCLDGSPPAYHFAPGSGAGANNWLVHIEGGGWCHNVTNCLFRMKGRLGSSRYMGPVMFSGILNDNRMFNPYFYNWNRIKVGYCDGSSFTGDVERVDPGTKLHYRGARIFGAVMQDLMARGMRYAKNAVLSGCSAGGLTALLHCDRFRELLPASARVKCLTDGGFFINLKDIAGVDYIETYFRSIVDTHGSAKNLPPSCTSTMDPHLCFFPQYVLSGVRTPLFVLNAAYDSWQIRNVLVPPGSDPSGRWAACRDDIRRCSADQINAMQVFRAELLNALGAGDKLGRGPAGYFVNSCFAHCQSELTATWQFRGSPVIDNTTVAVAVGEWYYEESTVEKLDCPRYPCDSSCYNNVYGDVGPEPPSEFEVLWH